MNEKPHGYDIVWGVMSDSVPEQITYSFRKGVLTCQLPPPKGSGVPQPRKNYETKRGTLSLMINFFPLPGKDTHRKELRRKIGHSSHDLQKSGLPTLRRW